MGLCILERISFESFTLEWARVRGYMFKLHLTVRLNRI
jgi:hypothetical protein